MNEIGFGGASFALFGLVALAFQFMFQVAATLAALFVWDWLRRRRAR